uniref:C-type lectin domain-containing protein n=1 Tax=Salarias fasciatus TaxID=181472 RepID=A0A672HKU3_SALFA
MWFSTLFFRMIPNPVLHGITGAATPSAAPLEEKNTKLQRGGCPPFWYGFNDRCYRYVAAHRTWIDAERHCVSLGANLVSIHRVQEHEFVRLLIANFDLSHGVDFVFWSPREPNNHRGESCVETNWAETKRSELCCAQFHVEKDCQLFEIL